MDNTLAKGKGHRDKPWLYRTQAAGKTQHSPFNNVTDIQRRQMNLFRSDTAESCFLKSLDERSFWTGSDIKRVPDGSFISVFLRCENKSAFNAHLKLTQTRLALPPCFLYTYCKGHFVGGMRTSSICICPSDQWIWILASWPVSLAQQKANENGNWEENLLSDSDKNKEPKMHN